MIEPNMATMLAFIMTDADIDRAELDTRFRHSVERSFNSLSVDSDTSTSDTAIVLANGAAGDDPDEFGRALDAVCLELTRMLATDGEGATTLIEVEVTEAVDDAQAKNVAKAILNSPLVKTAVFGHEFKLGSKSPWQSARCPTNASWKTRCTSPSAIKSCFPVGVRNTDWMHCRRTSRANGSRFTFRSALAKHHGACCMAVISATTTCG